MSYLSECRDDSWAWQRMHSDKVRPLADRQQTTAVLRRHRLTNVGKLPTRNISHQCPVTVTLGNWKVIQPQLWQVSSKNI